MYIRENVVRNDYWKIKYLKYDVFLHIKPSY